MLITFRSKSHNVTMFGDVALKILSMMGHSGAVPGAILAKDVPQALDQLNSAIELEKMKAKPVEPEDDNDDEYDEYVDPPVSIVNRALPILELLNTAVRDECNVMWDKE
ncbi:DUF1840 domain-containing protein [Vibrio japonicus]|uniref:DUF1840 domain-containing protein n=1 Tax=Vibrio japonicus TaxID=1824638 RepID=A0ABY5LN19_9VIBR|nr:DUF1840 domain-containing protein [Vibrio japonicus]UUM32502.1 DUF1840 domain-containing protein [Vibrio japonicus]